MVPAGAAMGEMGAPVLPTLRQPKGPCDWGGDVCLADDKGRQPQRSSLYSSPPPPNLQAVPHVDLGLELHKQVKADETVNPTLRPLIVENHNVYDHG